MSFSEEELLRLSFGYNLDCGGRRFENPEDFPELEALGAVIEDDPKTDDFPWMADAAADYVHGFEEISCPLYAFIPDDSGVHWPEALLAKSSSMYRLVGHGELNDTDRDCHCHGQYSCPNCQAVIMEPLVSCPVCDVERQWNPTGNIMDPPFPECNRCDGDGLVDSSGGAWALYARMPDDLSGD